MVTADEDRSARLVLSVIGEPGDPRLTSLVAELGPVVVLDALRDQSRRSSLAAGLAERLRAARPDDVLEAAGRRGIRFVTPGDPEWPTGLDDLALAPFLHERGGVPVALWVRGPLQLDQAVAGSCAVVGARSATTYGTRVAGEIGAGLAEAAVGVVSGAAFGIDQAGHRGALAGRGVTVAVLACGADRAYPAAHQQLLDYVADVGLVVSEAAPGCAPTKIRFLARNRLIAALTAGTVVVEAAVRSGALNTASWADALHRRVMGVPGPVTSAASEGVHALVRNRDALLVTGAADVLEAISTSGAHRVEHRSAPVAQRDRLTTEQRQVLDAVPVRHGVGAARIARTAGVPEAVAAAALLVLVGAGLVEQGAGRWRLTAGTAPAPTGSG